MTHKIHRPYEALLRSIDFFSQNLHVDQITQYGFKLFNDLVLPKCAVLYLLKAGIYTPLFTSGYTNTLPNIDFTQSHDDFAMRNGFILEQQSTQQRYFDAELLENLNVEYVMPLISGNKLMGFIFFEGSDMLPQPDIAFMTRFNHMLNLSLEKACRFEETSAMKAEIDKRLFNLASLSQTTKLLMSELEVDKIYQLSIDVIRELTSSSFTSFSTYCVHSKKFITKAYQDIVTFEKKVVHLEPIDHDFIPSQHIYHIEEDALKLQSLFKNPEALKQINAQYIFLLIKDRIQGFFTVGKPVGALEYEPQLLNQIVNVAGLVQLALTNARLFEQTLEQKQFMQKQTQLLKKINRSVKTINSAETLDELCQISMDTLQYAFGVEVGFIATLADGMIELKAPIGFEKNTLDPICQEQLNFQINQELIVSYVKPDLESYMCDSLVSKLPESNCLVIAPIRTSGWNSQPLGCIVVLRMNGALKEEQTVLIDSLADSIAPVVNQFRQIHDLHSTTLPNPELKIRSLFENYEYDKSNYGIDYTVWLKYVPVIPFENTDYSHYEGLDFVHIHNIIVCFTSSSEVLTSMDHAFMPNSYNDLTHSIQRLHLNPPTYNESRKTIPLSYDS